MIEQARIRLAEFKALVPDVKLPNWLLDRLEVLPKVYPQQKYMYDNHTRTIPDHIVSRRSHLCGQSTAGNALNPRSSGKKLHLSVVDGYTFLEQTIWSNFNDGCDLQAAAEDYLRKFGCYPEAILADKIYQTRANRAWCRERGIRLFGPALGRRKVGDTRDARQMYKDACARNAVEGRNGNLKRRFNLDLIMSKLDDRAKTEAALNILAMNATYWLCRWLARFFALWRVSVFSKA